MNGTIPGNLTDLSDAFSFGLIILTVVDVMLIIVVTVGNSLTVVAVARYRRLQSSNNVLLASLAVADLFMGIVYTPTKVMYTMWPSLFLSRMPCIMYIFNTHFCGFYAVISLSVLSIERGYAVQFPFHYHSNMTVRRSVILSFGTFMVIVFLNLPMLMGTDHYNGKNCFAPLIFPKVYLRTLIAICVSILLLGFVAFVRVMIAEIRLRKDMDVWSGQQLKQRLTSVRCRLMCVVYVSSIAFWLPHLLYYFYVTFAKQERNLMVFRVFSIFDLCSSAVNFFIYGFKNTNFRMAYRQLLGLAKRRPVVTSLEVSTTVELEGQTSSPSYFRTLPIPSD